MVAFLLTCLVLIVVGLSLERDFFAPIGCPRCGDPLIDHLQKQERMPDYCPKCGERLW